MSILTSRLELRPLRPDDAPALAAYRNDPAIAAFQGWPLPYGLSDAAALIDEMAGRTLGVEPGWVQWGVARPGGPLLGDVALRRHGPQAEIGLTLAPASHGQGFATEAGLALLAHAFGTLKLRRLHAGIDPRNLTVTRLLARLSFRHEGTLREAYEHRGEWADEALYALLASEWAQSGADREA
ncbi:GNAT family N-acetyltransferase [Deinococcus koreensis]|uniref:N-acetyltransferase n=1 Tax=Deinococcus koreensis TaxID=2054903 RepID=A0A2K3USH5_9DEIO|nr:GNAT family protein [Deinococcus koreensis]PNY79467.1 N-acetyltransferase [Deinococcus koreensis]